jgi:acetyl esterase/lipase
MAGNPLAMAEAPPHLTHTYKRTGDLEIKADILCHSVSTSDPRSVVIYLHGGSLIGGSREKLIQKNFPLKDMFLEAGYIVVSIDYRLAPETKLPAMVSDVEDAIRWVRERGPALFNADPNRIAVWGSSAGGYLAFLTGHRVEPRPQVLVVEFGYADIVGSWQTEPSRDPDHYLPRSDFASEADAWREVSGPPIADVADRKGDGGAFNGYVRQRGLWPMAVSGWDPLAETEKFVPYLPVRNVSADYPPTFIIHGREDLDIPYAVAEDMVAELVRCGVEHRLIGIDHGGHGYIGADPTIVEQAHRQAFEFVYRHFRRNDEVTGGAHPGAAREDRP